MPRRAPGFGPCLYGQCTDQASFVHVRWARHASTSKEHATKNLPRVCEELPRQGFLRNMTFETPHLRIPCLIMTNLRSNPVVSEACVASRLQSRTQPQARKEHQFGSTPALVLQGAHARGRTAPGRRAPLIQRSLANLPVHRRGQSRHGTWRLLVKSDLRSTASVDPIFKRCQRLVWCQDCKVGISRRRGKNTNLGACRLSCYSIHMDMDAPHLDVCSSGVWRTSPFTAVGKAATSLGGFL